MSHEDKDANQSAPKTGDFGWAGKTVVLMSPEHGEPDSNWVARVSIVDGSVTCDNADQLEDWNRNGILGRSDKGVIYPRDGQTFLDELPFVYRSVYLWAEPVEG